MSQDNKANEENIEEKKTIETEQEDDLSEKVNSEESEEGTEEEGKDEEPDYKSEYERLQGELAQKNERIAKQDKKIIKLKQKDGEEEEETEEKSDVDELVNQAVQKQMSAFVGDTIEEELSKASSNEDEQKLIKWYFDNRIVKTGWSKKEIIGYIEDAKILANKGKMLSKMKIIAKKNKSDETAGSPAFAGTPPKPSPKITEYDRKQAEKFFNGDVKRWMKYKPNN
jgi:hypothetical protein